MNEIEFLTAEDVCSIQHATLPGVPSHSYGLVEGAVTRIINEYLYYIAEPQTFLSWQPSTW